MFGFEKKQEIIITPDMVRSTVRRCLPYTLTPATRSNSGDVECIYKALDALGVKAVVLSGTYGITYRYALDLSKLSDIHTMLSSKSQQVFEFAFGTPDVRIVQEGPYVVIEVPGADDRSVLAADVLMNDEYYNARNLKAAVGLTMDRKPILMDLDKAPHVLIAGETGSGKSVLMHQIVVSLLMNHSSQDLKLYMVDPKRVELSLYAPLRNVTMVNDAIPAVDMLKNLCAEMDKRYKYLSIAHVRDIEGYNAKVKPFGRLPRIVVFIDELSDLMSQGLKKQTEAYIVRLAQLGRACGIHLVIATQRPDRTVVTGLIKDNIPVRICLSVSSGINSRIILDRMGGEKLIGKGDLLYLANGARDAIRCQAGNITEKEILSIVYTLMNR